MQSTFIRHYSWRIIFFFKAVVSHNARKKISEERLPIRYDDT